MPVLHILAKVFLSNLQFNHVIPLPQNFQWLLSLFRVQSEVLPRYMRSYMYWPMATCLNSSPINVFTLHSFSSHDNFLLNPQICCLALGKKKLFPWLSPFIFSIFLTYGIVALICRQLSKIPLGNAESEYYCASTEIIKYNQLNKFNILDSSVLINGLMGNFVFSTETFTFFFDNIECIRLRGKKQ